MVSDPSQLREWCREADPKQATEVLLGLAGLAGFDCGDDADAARVLAWLLLPTVLMLRRQLRTVYPSDELDAVLSAQVWLDVRSLRWQHQHWVAARFAARVKEGVLVDAGIATSRHPAPVDPVPNEAIEYVPTEDSEATSCETLTDLLEWAVESDVISDEDHLRIISLLVVARGLDQIHSLPRNCGAAGIASDRVTGSVATKLSLCQRTVRRRTARCIAALEAASDQFLKEVAV